LVCLRVIGIIKVVIKYYLKAIAKQRSKKIFKELIQQNIQLLDDNRNKISNEMIEAMNAKNLEDYIKNYSQRMISKSR